MNDSKDELAEVGEFDWQERRNAEDYRFTPKDSLSLTEKVPSVTAFFITAKKVLA
jgi:hypothetical protein